MPNLLIFGSTGALGSAISEKFKAQGYQITYAVRAPISDSNHFILPIANLNKPSDLPKQLSEKVFDAVVFAQGMNTNDSAINYQDEMLQDLFAANVSFILENIRTLMKFELIKNGAKIVIISSLWEQLTRQEKMSYTVTKAAVGGLVRSLAVDLGKAKGILVNGILPGVVETPMSRGLLTDAQINNIQNQTPTNKLVQPVDVANAIYLLACEENTAISGQSIFVDYGFSIARVL
jgi:3-oxoacyl-[acyl-carrier protein] reductase